MSGPRKASERMLRNVALFYLQRFGASAASLRRVLLRRVERSARVHNTDRGEGAALVEAVVAGCITAGLIDDKAFAAARAARLHRRGKPAHAIVAHLHGKGIARELIDEVLADLGREAGGDLAAAVNFARRRRLGPFRAAGKRADADEADLAAFARGGFSYAIARRVLGAISPEDLDPDDRC
jgi:regulatory protein